MRIMICGILFLFLAGIVYFYLIVFPTFEAKEDGKKEDSTENSGLNRCEICGDTTPPGKTLCWCCEHTPKLHHAEKEKQACEGKDFCEI